MELISASITPAVCEFTLTTSECTDKCFPLLIASRDLETSEEIKVYYRVAKHIFIHKGFIYCLA